MDVDTPSKPTLLNALRQNGGDAETVRAVVARPEGAPAEPWLLPEFATLTPRQQAFVRMYLTEARGNASEAVRLSGMDVKSVRATAHQILRTPKVQHAISLLEPKVRAWELWQIHATAPEILAKGEVKAPTAGPPPTMTRQRLIRVMAAMAEGRDPRWDIPGSEPAYPIVLRAQDMVSAAKLLADLKGWRKTTMVHEGNPKKPLMSVTADLRGRTLEELEQMRTEKLATRAKLGLPPPSAETETQ